MLNQEAKIYAIPGWGFQASVFNMLNNENFHIDGLDYIHLSQLTLTEIAQNLSASLAEQSVLLGWSFGGLLAIKISALFPKKVKKLILLDSQPRLLASLNWTGIDQITSKNFEKALQQGFKKQMNWFIRLVCYPNRSPAIRQVLKQHLFQESIQELTSLLSLLFDADLRDEYRNLDSDVLHIISEQDMVIPQNRIQLTALNPRINTRTFPGTEHAGFLTNRVAYIDAIKGFLNAN